MAVDTAQKRFSMFSFGGEQIAERRPAATNFDSAEDRAQSLFLYAGIDIGSSSPIISTETNRKTWWWFFRRRR